MRWIKINLKVLFMFLLYYGFLSLLFTLASSVETPILNDYNTSIALNDTTLQSDEIDTGGLFGTGVSFSRFFVFIGFGVGLPDSTPTWFNTIFIIWESLISVLFVGFILSSIWNG